ncbi:MAG: YhbY family RNA-binding protein [Rhodocyclaceae bacterium]|nr:YhbY family RNA-binding protein [Rhodocyclaceae bacterium]
MSDLTPEIRRSLRARAHALSPVVSIANKGLSAAVLKEIDRSLDAHELIKVRVYGVERTERELLLAEICNALGAQPVQHIGNILVVFRERPQAPVAPPAAAPKPAAARKTPAPARHGVKAAPRGTAAEAPRSSARRAAPARARSAGPAVPARYAAAATQTRRRTVKK